jgi:hypothetical protein
MKRHGCPRLSSAATFDRCPDVIRSRWSVQRRLTRGEGPRPTSCHCAYIHAPCSRQMPSMAAAIGIGEQKHGHYTLAPEWASEYIAHAGRSVVVAELQNHADVALRLPEGRDHFAPAFRGSSMQNTMGAAASTTAHRAPSKDRPKTVPVVAVAVDRDDSRFRHTRSPQFSILEQSGLAPLGRVRCSANHPAPVFTVKHNITYFASMAHTLRIVFCGGSNRYPMLPEQRLRCLVGESSVLGFRCIIY